MSAESRPVLSTILVTANQADLLVRTLDSLFATVEVPHELFVVDNGSRDGSADILRRFCATHPDVVPIFLPTTPDSHAFNTGLERAAGQYIHLAGSALEYRPGWSRTAVDLFDHFPGLGQLSLWGPVQEEEAGWTPRPCTLRHSRGRIVYESFVDLETPFILRRTLIGQDARGAGYFMAFSPHDLVSYFDEREPPHHARPARASFLFPGQRVSAEKSPPNPECPEPWLWSMFDGWTAEMETVELLYALVRLAKPRFVLETGTWHGIAAHAMGRALRDNGRGRLVSIEVDAGSYEKASERIRAAGLQPQVELVLGSSLAFTPGERIDLALFDSELSLRAGEFARYEPFLSPGALVLFHDVSSRHAVVGAAVTSLLEQGILDGFLLDTPRGLAVCRYRGSRHGPDRLQARHQS